MRYLYTPIAVLHFIVALMYASFGMFFFAAFWGLLTVVYFMLAYSYIRGYVR